MAPVYQLCRSAASPSGDALASDGRFHRRSKRRSAANPAHEVICKVARFARSGPLLFGLMQAEADSILGARRRKGGGAKSIRIDGRNALHGRRAQTHVAGSLH